MDSIFRHYQIFKNRDPSPRVYIYLVFLQNGANLLVDRFKNYPKPLKGLKSGFRGDLHLIRLGRI
jgi:hypothetical protein